MNGQREPLSASKLPSVCKYLLLHGEEGRREGGKQAGKTVTTKFVLTSPPLISTSDVR